MVAREETGSFIQLLKVDLVAGFDHLFIALETALDSFEKETNFSPNREIEFLLRLFGKRQIDKILPLLESNTNKVILIVADKGQKEVDQAFERIEKELKFQEEKKLENELGKNVEELKKVFQITKETDSLKDLENSLEAAIIEKVALSTLQE